MAGVQILLLVGYNNLPLLPPTITNVCAPKKTKGKNIQILTEKKEEEYVTTLLLSSMETCICATTNM